MAQPPQEQTTVARYAFAGITLAGTVLGMMLAGAWIDHKWGLSPWGVVGGSIVGVVGGLYNFIKEFANDSSNSQKRL